MNLTALLRSFLGAKRPNMAGQSNGRSHYRPMVEMLEDRQLLSAFMVSNTANDGAGSLRAAILAANANPGFDTIQFDLEPGGAQTISLTSPLPTLADAVFIDGTSQPGWIASPLVTVDGIGLNDNGTFNGLTTTADGCKIKGLVLKSFSGAAVGLYSNNNVIAGNSLLSSKVGVEIADAVTGNVIGGTTVRGRNVISGNGTGVAIHERSTGNLVQGNFIGTDVGGGASFGNGIGVDLEDGASNNTIGGTAVGAGNVISGNTARGVLIGADAAATQLLGNKIGTNATGTAPVANSYAVQIYASNTTVGGTAAGAGNLISGNTFAAILIEPNANFNTVLGNKIGTNAAGTAILANQYGLDIYGSNNTVGGSAAGAGNLISGSANSGVYIEANASGNLVAINKIGTNVAGTAALANSNGVTIEGSSNTAAGNLISGNTTGVRINSNGSGNVLQGNKIGTDVLGVSALPNVAYGVDIQGSNNTVGVLGLAANLISGNGTGIFIGTSATLNHVVGNNIGTNVAGTGAVANNYGVDIEGPNNTIGGFVGLVSAGNLISGNTTAGVRIKVNPEATGNQVQGNKIGTNLLGTSGLGNLTGVDIFGSNNTVGGTATGAGNLISGNSTGVRIEANASGNQLQGNKIGTNAAGTAALTNFYGVDIFGSTNTVGGPAAGALNLISGNSTGVRLESNATTNVVSGNNIGTNALGTSALANVTGVDILGSSNTVGGNASLDSNLISGNTNAGVQIEVNATGNLVRGNIIGINKIGTNAAATATLANGTGVDIFGTSNTVGGTAAGALNVISGNTSDGVRIEANASGNQVLGNKIGTNAAGTAALGNAGNGVNILGGNNTVGGTAAVAGNIIAFNHHDGVLVNTGGGNSIRQNSIFANTHLGIEPLNGANNSLPAPILTSATFYWFERVLIVSVSLTSTASANFTVEFFGNPTGTSQGQIYLGAFVTFVNAGTTVVFSAHITVTTTAFSSITTPMITATATDPDGNTSQFSNAVHDPVEPTSIRRRAPIFVRRRGY